ncbi:MAG: translocation/assembly module TamB domain-containing protein [Deltaproteobacteria bacterium]|nr:translocation/assembly module TamB domain-containing protein [Deltaproteobacteria bacterium]
MRRTWRWIRRIVVGLLATVIVAVAVVLILLHTAWGRNFLRGRIEAALQAPFPGSSIGSLSGSVLGTVTLHDISLVAADGHPIATVDALDVDLALLPLFGRTARIEHLVATGVTVHAHPAPPPRDDGKPPPAWTVEIVNAEIHDATVIDEHDGVTLSNVDVSASARIDVRGPIIAIATLGGDWKGRPFGGLASLTIRRDLAFDVGAGFPKPQFRDVAGFVAAGSGGASLVGSLGSMEARTGSLVARLPASDVLRLPLEGRVGGDAIVLVSADGDRLSATVTIGGTRVDSVAIIDVQKQSVRGVLATNEVDLGVATGQRVSGRGRVMIAGVLERDRVRATVLTSGAIPNYPAGDSLIAIDAPLDRSQSGIEMFSGGDVMLFSRGEGELLLSAVGSVKRVERTFLVERAHVGIAIGDPVAASGGRAPVRGTFTAEVSASGPLTALVLQGNVRGTRLSFERASARALTGTFRVTIDKVPMYTAHVALDGVVNAGKPIGSVVADARNRANGSIEIRARARSATMPVTATISGVVTPGATTTDAVLGSHSFETPAGVWAGTGGRVRIGKRDIVVTGIRTTQGEAWAKVGATVGRGTGALAADIEAHALPLRAIDPAYSGTVSGALTLARKRGRWSGSGMLSGQGVVVSPEAPPVDAGITLGVDGRRVAIAINASNAELGGARVAIEVDSPVDLLDVPAWMRVARSDLHAVVIGVDHVDLAAVSKGKTTGFLDGTLEIREGVPSGTLSVRGVPTPLGQADADMTLSLTDVGFVDATAKATVGTVGAATLGARIAIPDRIFDPAAWKALGTRVVDRAIAEAKDIAIGPELFAALKIDAPYRGKASIKVDVGAGGSSATVGVDVHGVTGGAIVRGVDAHLQATVDSSGTRAELGIAEGGVVLASLPDARTPVTLAGWIADPRAAIAAPVSGTLSIGKLDVARVLAIVGRTDVRAGTIAGAVTVGGTIGRPTAKGSLELQNVQVAPRYSAKTPPELTALHIDASWDGAAGQIKVKGDEAGKGTLEVEVRGRPDDLMSVVARVDIKKFDVAPIVVFLPGRLAGASGRVEADLTFTGIDPVNGKVRGSLELIEARVPITPTIGTLRRANAKLELRDDGITAKLDGRLGAGAVKLTATSDSGGLDTIVDATLSKISPIGALQPIISSTLHATLRRDGFVWTGKATVSRTSVVMPAQGGNALLDADAPPDLIFVDLPIPRIPIAPGAPENPFLIVAVDIRPVEIRVPEFAVDAVAAGRVTLKVGETVGLDGQIFVERGSADLFGHRYRVELGQVMFDGTLNGILDLKLAHDFPDVTTFVRFSGRLNELANREPEFTSSPGIYTPGQLLGFFLGGEPGGDPSKQTREAAAGFGASFASSAIGKRLKKYLPLNLDVLRCDPGAGTSGASCTLGKWLTHKVFLSYKQRLESRYDQNTGEGSFEWHFKPSWVLEVTGGDRNYWGTDALWRRRW